MEFIVYFFWIVAGACLGAAIAGRAHTETGYVIGGLLALALVAAYVRGDRLQRAATAARLRRGEPIPDREPASKWRARLVLGFAVMNALLWVLVLIAPAAAAREVTVEFLRAAARWYFGIIALAAWAAVVARGQVVFPAPSKTLVRAVRLSALGAAACGALRAGWLTSEAGSRDAAAAAVLAATLLVFWCVIAAVACLGVEALLSRPIVALVRAPITTLLRRR